MTSQHDTTINYNPLVTPEVKARFMSFVSIDKETDAWIWTGGITGSGYGAFWLNGKTVSAHRISYEIKYGLIENDLFVCHKYESLGKTNINPEHLFLGTNTDNLRDAATKGRTARGMENAASKLTDEEVLEISLSKKTNDELVIIYSVSNPLISKIRRGELWGHITGITQVDTHSLRNKSGYRGVSWAKKQGLWYSCITANKKTENLGYYNDKVEAAIAYDTAAKRLHGDKANLNF